VNQIGHLFAESVSKKYRFQIKTKALGMKRGNVHACASVGCSDESDRPFTVE